MGRKNRYTDLAPQQVRAMDAQVVARAPTHKMFVVAQDPAVRDGSSILMSEIDVPAEDLAPGPIGYRVQVVDFDSTRGKFHGSHALPGPRDAVPTAWKNGDPAILSDYRFHAQNVYALVMKTLARFEFALGRRIPWSPRSFKSHQLKVAPHAMADPNAFYSPEAEGLVFGYFTGLSGKPVYTCLSHDVVVHETTHALLDALRERYIDPSSPDQAAFHEGFSDVVALLSVFAQREVVEFLLLGGRKPSGNEKFVSVADMQFEKLSHGTLFRLAKQMGSEMENMRGGALRQSASIKADKRLKDLPEFQESHRRGELFVAAVMQGFIRIWSDRVLGSAPPGQTMFPVSRVAEEGADIADSLLTMWIRAIDYMPPVHVEFGDALSAALTADLEVRPNDSRYELRQHMRDSFARFGFMPASRGQNDTGIWAKPPEGLRYDRVRCESLKYDVDEVFRFIWDNRDPDRLDLCDGAYTQVLNVRPVVRVGIDGFVVRETVAQYYQVARFTRQEMIDFKVHAPPAFLAALAAEERQQAVAAAAAIESGDEGDEHGHGQPRVNENTEPRELTTPLYGGGVLIFDEFGKVKYWIHNDVRGRSQKKRLLYLWDQGQLQPDRAAPRVRAARLSSLHRMRALGARDTTRNDRW
jgi:hypothetical protein